MLSTPEPLPSVRLWPALLGLLSLLVTFGWLGEEVWRHGGFVWEKTSLLALHAAASPGLDRLMATVSVLGGPRVMLPLAALGLLMLWWRRPRGWRITPFAPGTASRTLCRFSRSFPDLWRPALIVVGAAAMNVLAKLIVHRARPLFLPSSAPEADYSFPSGHARFRSRCCSRPYCSPGRPAGAGRCCSSAVSSSAWSASRGCIWGCITPPTCWPAGQPAGPGAARCS